MNYDPREMYLETQIKTATPQRLRLMLIEGALRFALQAKEARLAGNFDRASECFERSRDIVGELLAGIRPGPHQLSDVARGLYGFVFKSLAEAQLLGELRQVDEAIRVLAEERETWQLVCEMCPEPPEDAADYRAEEVLAPTSAAAAPMHSGLSLEA